MNWINLTAMEQIDAIKERSYQVPCLVLKHSTTCSISKMALGRLEGKWDFEGAELEPYYLDLLNYRPISAALADVFNVHHESPQVLLIKNGECIYDASHLDISVDELHEVYA